jgi:hypothetical protein
MTMREMADAVANNIADAVSQCLWHGDNDYGFDTDEAAMLIAPILTTVFQRIADEAAENERERAAWIATERAGHYTNVIGDIGVEAKIIAAAIRQPPQPESVMGAAPRL